MGSLKFKYMWKNKVIADVEVNYFAKTVKVINYDDCRIKRPFGIVINPTIEQFEEFLESRCFPRTRYNCKQLLQDLDISFYDPLLIVQKTHGRQLEDYNWIKFEGEDDLDYERDIKLRD